MRCPDCEYELHGESQPCPRCAFRRAVPAPAPAPPPSPVAAAPPAPTEEVSAAPRRNPPPKWAGALLALVLLGGAGAGFLHSTQGQGTAAAAARQAAATQQAQEAQVRALFAAAEGPCRYGEAVPCQANIGKIRALGDQPDASLLLTDLKVAAYLHTLPGGDRLSERWQRDQITQPELTAMGNVAYRKNLRVYRSLWIGADIKRDKVPVPRLVFGGANLPGASE